MKYGCSVYFFINFATLICQGTDISKLFQSFLVFEIMRFCIFFMMINVFCGGGGGGGWGGTLNNNEKKYGNMDGT